MLKYLGIFFRLLDRTNDYKITPSKELKEYLEIELKDNLSIDAEKLSTSPKPKYNGYNEYF